MRTQHANATELVDVIGPVEVGLGKKQTYGIRKMKRGLAENPIVKEMGIEIVANISEGQKSITVEGSERRAPGRKSLAEKENEQLRAELAGLKEQMMIEAKAKTNPDADQK